MILALTEMILALFLRMNICCKHTNKLYIIRSGTKSSTSQLEETALGSIHSKKLHLLRKAI